MKRISMLFAAVVAAIGLLGCSGAPPSVVVDCSQTIGPLADGFTINCNSNNPDGRGPQNSEGPGEELLCESVRAAPGVYVSDSAPFANVPSFVLEPTGEFWAFPFGLPAGSTLRRIEIAIEPASVAPAAPLEPPSLTLLQSGLGPKDPWGAPLGAVSDDASSPEYSKAHLLAIDGLSASDGEAGSAVYELRLQAPLAADPEAAIRVLSVPFLSLDEPCL